MRPSILIAIAALGISAYAGFLFVGEYRAARLALATRTTSFMALLDATPPRTGSLYADRIVFLACNDALTGRLARLQPQSAIDRIASYCKTAAQDALTSSPTSTLAHFAMAQAAQTLGDFDAMNQHLLASQQNGSFESWLAKRRFKLALLAGTGLNRAGGLALDGDIASLLQSAKGRIFIAKYYVLRPKLKERILGQADALGAEIQAALLKRISVALRAQAGGA